METQIKNMATDKEERIKNATNLTLDQYIKRYVKLITPQSYDNWLKSTKDTDQNGIITNAENRNFNKRFKTQEAINKGYADYLDSVIKTNAYLKEEAVAEWESARYFESDGAVFDNAFGEGSTGEGYRTNAEAKQQQQQQQQIFDFKTNTVKYLLIGSAALVVIFFIMKMKQK